MTTQDGNIKEGMEEMVACLGHLISSQANPTESLWGR